MRRRSSCRRFVVVISSPPIFTEPFTQVPGVRSYIRLKIWSRVLFPHPEAPIIAVILCSAIVLLTSCSARKRP
jgi:hypothetical protein